MSVSSNDNIHRQKNEVVKGKKEAGVSEQSKKFSKTDKINLPERFQHGLANSKADPKNISEDINLFGFFVCATNKGSMTQDNFYYYYVTFFDNLQKNQGSK